MSQESFKPDGALASVFIAATATASATAIPNGSGCQLRLVNEGTVAIRIGFGTSASAPTTVSTTAGMSMLPSSAETFTIDQQLINQPGYIYVCAASSTATVNVTRGSGV
jgi:hypothetical protein